MPKRSSRPDQRLRAQLAERDGWVCCRCRRTIPRHLSYPHPMSVSLEHLVPVVKGGRSTPDTCSVSHLRCNQSHGAPLGSRSPKRKTNRAKPPPIRTDLSW